MAEAPDQARRPLYFIALSSDKYPPFRVDTTALFGEEFSRLGHRFDWVMQSEGACDAAYVTDWNGNKVWVGPTDNGESRSHRVRKHLLWLAHQLKTLWITRANPYDFVMVKNKYLIAIPALLHARLRKIKFIFWLSYPHAEEGLFKVREGTARYPFFYWLRGHALTFLLYRLVLPGADHVFVQSEQMKQDIAHKGIDPRKMTAVPMGVSLDEFDRYRSQQSDLCDHADAWKQRRNIVYLGTLQSARKMDFLVRVLSEVLKSEPNAFLTLVGDGDSPGEREIITQEAERLGIADRLRITGFLPRSDAMMYVKAADVCVSPFYPDPILNSTSPTKLVEYWAMERPVVANDHPEQSLTIAQSGGGICTAYDEGAFANAIVTILRDPERANEMGRAGRRYVEECRDYRQLARRVEHQLCRTMSMAL